MTRVLVKPVQEKNLRATLQNQSDMRFKVLKIRGNTFCHGFRFFGQANCHFREEKIIEHKVIV